MPYGQLLQGFCEFGQRPGRVALSVGKQGRGPGCGGGGLLAGQQRAQLADRGLGGGEVPTAQLDLGQDPQPLTERLAQAKQHRGVDRVLRGYRGIVQSSHFRAGSYSYRSSSRRRADCMWWYITVVTRFSS